MAKHGEKPNSTYLHPSNPFLDSTLGLPETHFSITSPISQQYFFAISRNFKKYMNFGGVLFWQCFINILTYTYHHSYQIIKSYMIIKSVQIEFCQQNLSLFCEFFYSQNIPTANKYMKFFKDEKIFFQLSAWLKIQYSAEIEIFKGFPMHFSLHLAGWLREVRCRQWDEDIPKNKSQIAVTTITNPNMAI